MLASEAFYTKKLDGYRRIDMVIEQLWFRSTFDKMTMLWTWSVCRAS